MQENHLIPTEDFCSFYSIEYSFISSLRDQGLIEVKAAENKEYIMVEELQKIEKLIRLHYEMDVNVEGIDVITHLLQKMNTMHEEIILLKNKLRRFETNE